MKKLSKIFESNTSQDIDLHEIADIEGLTVIETTTGSNGYPQHLKYGLIDFDNWEQFQEIKNKYDLTEFEGFKKDGWQLYNRRMGYISSPYEASADRYGDNCMVFSKSDADTYYESEVKPRLDDYDLDGDDFPTFDQLKHYVETHDGDDGLFELVKKHEDILNRISELGDDKSVVICDGHWHDTVDSESMSWSDDSKTHVIGLMENPNKTYESKHVKINEEVDEIEMQFRVDTFEDDVLEELYSLGFDKENIKPLFSLGYSQGDGFCLDGHVTSHSDLWKDSEIKKIFFKGLTPTQRKTAEMIFDNVVFRHDGRYYFKESSDIEVYFVDDDMFKDLELEDMTPSQRKVADKIIENVTGWYNNYCDEKEKMGYDILYDDYEEE